MSEAAAPNQAPTTTAGDQGPITGSPQNPANDNDSAGAGRSPTPVHTGAPANDNAQPSAGERAELKDAQQAGDLTAAQFRALADGGKVKLKVYGKEREVDAAEALRILQRGAAGDDAMRTAAEERKKVDAEREKLKGDAQKLGHALRSDPLAVLRRLGLEDALLAQYEREVEYQKLPEEQRTRHEIDRERQRLAQERQAWQQEQERHKQAQERQRAEAQAQADAQAWNRDLVQALEGVGFGKNETKRKRAIAYMCERAQAFVDNGLEIPPAPELARDAKEYFLEEAREYARSLDPAEAEEQFGADFMRALRKADVARLKETQSRAPGGQFATGNTARVESPAPQGKNGRQQVRYTGSLASYMAARDAKLNGR